MCCELNISFREIILNMVSNKELIEIEYYVPHMSDGMRSFLLPPGSVVYT